MPFLFLLSSLISLTLSELVADRACFNAKDKSLSTIFSIDNEGVIEGIRLTFLSGGVTCVLAGQLTHWGCVGLYSATYLYKVTSEQLHEGYELYPKIKGFAKSPLLPSGTASDNVVLIDYNLGFYRFNDLSKNWDTPVLEIRNPVYAVDHGDKFMLQYSEAYRNKANVDNSGTTCVRVEFLYSHSYDKVTLDDPACFFANDKEKSTIFAVPHEGMLAGIDLEFDYTSGQQGVQCLVGVPKSHWGCEYTHDIEVWLYKVEYGHNGSPIFPRQGTRGYQLVSSVWDSYWLSGFDRDSGRIVLMDPPTYVTPPMDMMLQYGEAYKRIDTYNNVGATCAKVHLIYQKADFAKKESMKNDDMRHHAKEQMDNIDIRHHANEQMDNIDDIRHHAQMEPILKNIHNNEGSLSFTISDKHTSKIIVGLLFTFVGLMLCTCVLFYLYVCKIGLKSKDIGYNTVGAVDNTCV